MYETKAWSEFQMTDRQCHKNEISYFNLLPTLYIYTFVSFSDMKKANTIGADKYFHAKGNYEAAKRGTGGKHAAAIIR